MVEVDIGALVKAVMRGLVGGRGEVVVDVCKAATTLALIEVLPVRTTYSVVRDTSPC
jgi:hypothetical protein